MQDLLFIIAGLFFLVSLDMSIFSDNIRFLRYRRNESQSDVAEKLLITRGRYGKYEDGVNEPPIELLVRISKYFRVSIDLLVTVDIRKYPIDEIIALPDNRLVLPVMVDRKGENRIELVPHRASMGYISGYTDPDYIESLQTISLPFLRNGKYRAFPAEGDSMPPYNDGTLLVGKYVEGKEYLRQNRTYIFVTTDGIVYKRYTQQSESGTMVSSDNQFYEPYEIPWENVLEIWEFACSINTRELDAVQSNFGELKNIMLDVKEDLSLVRQQLLPKK